MIPSLKLIRLTIGLLLLAAIVLVFRLFGNNITQSNPDDGLFEATWASLFILVSIVALIDSVRGMKFRQLTLRRTLPSSLALGATAKVVVTIENPYSVDLNIEFTDNFSANILASELPLALTLRANTNKEIEYTITPRKRGLATFKRSSLRIRSRWGFWQRQLTLGASESARVYSNFTAVSHVAKIGLERHIANVGIHLQQLRGAGSDFHQLREFREGDAIRQIDWKATARYRKPISKDYQSERDQNIVFMLDCGRQMRNEDNEISYFDHALNALLITSYIALRQGDAVGLMSFAGDDRWLSPRKGAQVTNQLLNQLYDLHSSTDSSDYLGAAQQLLTRHRKRSLLVLISNVQVEASEDLKAAVALLRRKHFVLVANLRNDLIPKTLQTPVSDFNEALSFCEAIGFQSERDRLIAELRGSGVFVTDVLPKLLHIGLVSEYLKIKRSGLL